MTIQPRARMTVDEFLGWAETQPRRYELVDGEVVAMAPERTGHNRARMAVVRDADTGAAPSTADR